MTSPEHSPMPWILVESAEHHGPYITTNFGTTICDFYAMSNPAALSTASGGTSRPICYVDAVANARLVYVAVNSHASLLAAAKVVIDAFGDDYDETLSGDDNAALRALRAAIAAAEEPAP